MLQKEQIVGEKGIDFNERKIALWNLGLENIANTAREIGASWSFGSHDSGYDSFAAEWHIVYNRDNDGLITSIEIGNELGEYGGGGDHEGGATTENLWKLMQTGRERKLLAHPYSGEFKEVLIDTNRFRTKRMKVNLDNIKYQGYIPALNPTQKIQEFLEQAVAEFVAQIRESRWGAMRGEKPRLIVRALPTGLYNEYYKTGHSGFDAKSEIGMAINSGRFGEYGASHRQDLDYGNSPIFYK
ncbi:MAG: hypothetical protein PHX51_08400 [Clostridia bacterium]|nr:hypothetical protein [Clostridia bacterium]